MIRTSTAAKPWPLPFGGGKATFMLRAGDVIERGEFEAEMSEMGAGRVFDWQLKETFLAGLEALLPDAPEDLERFREIQTAVDGGDKLTSEDQALLDSARDAVRRSWPAYRELLAQAGRRGELVPTVAFMWFCDGWTGIDLAGEPLPEFKKSFDGRVAIDTMKQVPPILVNLAGSQAYNMLYATGEAKNSAGLSPRGGSPKRSNAARSKKAGSSAAKSGSRTRSSRSPATSSR